MIWRLSLVPPPTGVSLRSAICVTRATRARASACRSCVPQTPTSEICTSVCRTRISLKPQRGAEVEVCSVCVWGGGEQSVKDPRYLHTHATSELWARSEVKPPNHKTQHLCHVTSPPPLCIFPSVSLNGTRRRFLGGDAYPRRQH